MINWLKKNHILHDWGMWEDVKSIYDVYDGRLVLSKTPLGFYQEKYCKICNKVCRKNTKRKP